jgi:hypothetical protein
MRDVPDREPNVGLFMLWWEMVKADRELAGEPIHRDDLVLHFSGSGASCMVFAKDLDSVCAELELKFDSTIAANDV